MLITMGVLEQMAERRIREAIENGELDDLPGSGRPLKLDDDAMVPPSLRAAYRLLKNAGFLPPEIETRREIATVHQLLAAAQTNAERCEALRRLGMLELRLAAGSGRPVSLAMEERYRRRLLERLGPRPVSE